MKNNYTNKCDTTRPLFLRGWAFALAMSTAFSPVIAAAGTPVFPGLYGRTIIPFNVDVGALPLLLNPGSAINGATVTTDNANHTVEIFQNQGKDKVTIDWSSFNIGSGSSVHFYQGKGTPGTTDWTPNSDYAVLNRIYDLNPTVIRGSLTGDGKIYMINRNGIFFAPDATVQVQSLAASTHNISDTNFNSGRLIFDSSAYNPNQTGAISDSATISNEGNITTNYGGSVFMVGPVVQNSGTISAPGGKINLVGLKDGGKVEIDEIVETRGSFDVVYEDTSKAGTVTNKRTEWYEVDANGNKIIGSDGNPKTVVTTGNLVSSDGGWIGLHGNTVSNDGIIRAVTTRRQNGVIILAGKDSVSTGADSITEVSVSDSSEAMARLSINFQPGLVSLTGLAQKSDFTNSSYNRETLSRIDHEGQILAKSGTVQLEAVDRIFLGNNSSIDVSGYVVDRPMSDQFIDAQLNSVYLRDDYGQKTGVLLGKTVTVDLLKGSSIGDLSTYYLNITKTARELSTTGGSIALGAPLAPANHVLNDIIIQQGAKLDISGGYTNYSGDAKGSSTLIGADGKYYDISTAPQWMTYTGILGSTTKSYGKFGSETLSGVSFGGQLITAGTSNTTVADRVVGGDAGSLALSARTILNDGTLKADYVTGQYQIASTYHLDSDKNAATDSAEYQRYLNYLISVNRGLEAPKGGTLKYGFTLEDQLGAPAQYQEDAHITSAVVSKSVAPSTAGLAWDGALLDPSMNTYISADMINNAHLSNLEINANNSIKTEEGVAIALQAGGSYNANARNIEFLGSVDARGGSVNMLIRPNISSYGTAATNQLFTDINESIYLGSKSSINVSGETIDNSIYGLAPEAIRTSGITTGGSISLRQVSPSGTTGYVLTENDKANNIVVSKGSVLDVSGGYLISQKGTMTAGDAGTLTVKAPTISLGGTLKGFSQPGKKGGEIILHAQDVIVENTGKELPATFGANDSIDESYGLLGKLIIGADRLRDSGFSRISLSASNDLTVSEGVSLLPSTMKSAVPNKAPTSGMTCSNGICQLGVSDPLYLDQIGSSYIKLAAGTNVFNSANLDAGGNQIANSTTAKLTLSPNAEVTALNGGSITMSAPDEVDIYGKVEAPGGKITITAGNTLNVNSGAEISAKGYSRSYVSTVDGQLPALPKAYSGGTVALEASSGALNIDDGAVVDVSGADPVAGTVQTNKNTIETVMVAGSAGSLSLAYATYENPDRTTGGGLNLNGEIKGWGGEGKNGNTQNGTLTVKNKTRDLLLSEADVTKYQNSGFDDLTFSSTTQINLPADLNISVGRHLTLDSKLIQGSGAAGDTAYLYAPWITLQNSGVQTAGSAGSLVEPASGAIVIGKTRDDGNRTNYIDLNGSMQLLGFSDVKLHADKEITFSDTIYNSSIWKGELNLNANLTMEANRIYPTTASAFTVTTPGTATILPWGTADTSPIYSAGGSLTISAAGGIDHSGELAAPLGSITLDAGSTGQVYLSEDSLITTASSVPVAYGYFDNSKWYAKYINSNIPGTEVTEAPAKSITLNGKEVVVRQGAVQDLSGGGSVFATYFQPGIPGSNNPLTVAGRYVIMPDGSANRPGPSVYLDAIPSLGLKAGVYTLLSPEFAFVPGALVIQDTGKQLISGQTALSTEHYPVVAGYMTVMDTNISSQVMKGFSVRLATDVRKEGDFTVKSFTGGDGGSLTLSATGGAVYSGTFYENALTGFNGGAFNFSAANVEVKNSVGQILIDDYKFGDTLADANNQPINTLLVGSDTLSNRDFAALTLGNKDTTSTVVVDSNVNLVDKAVTLAAMDSITLKSGSIVQATGGNASVVTPTGTLVLESTSTLKSNVGISLDLKSAKLDGSMDAGTGGSFSLTANRLVFSDTQPTIADGTNVVLSDDQLNSFGKYGKVNLTSNSDMEFQRNLDLTIAGELTLDAGLYTGAKTVSFKANEIVLQNTRLNSNTTPVAGTGTIAFAADTISVAPRLDGTKGNIFFDKFAAVTLDSKNDLTFKGEGTVKTAGDLNLNAARTTTGYDRYKLDSSGNAVYTAANITLDASSGTVTLNDSNRGGSAGTSIAPGGSLQILGNKITQTGGVLDVTAGQIGLAATGDITIDGSIKATGSKQTAESGDDVYYGGGKITLQSDSGKVLLNGGSRLDVSAAAQGEGDAGAIVLSAKTGGVVKDAAAQLASNAGSSSSDKGGSLTIDSATLVGTGGLDGLSSILATSTLSDKTQTGGFNNLINIRSRSSEPLTLSKGITGREVVVAADGGSITIGSTGSINADTSDGSGRIELYSGTSLNLNGSLSAKGTAAGTNGGTVIMSSQANYDNSKNFNGVYALNVNSGSNINVAGTDSGGNLTNTGTVAFRAYQNAAKNDVNIAAVGGTISGASSVSVEAVAAKAFNADTTISSLSTYTSAATTFMNSNASGIKTRLFGTPSNTVDHLQAGIEISTTAGKNLIFNTATAQDLSTVRSNAASGNEAVILTLKSGKDLTISQTIKDAPTAIGTLHSNTGSTVTMQNSAGINLIAGSDGGANYMGVAKGSALAGYKGTGDLKIASGKFVYTENAPIRFAAGNDAFFYGFPTTGNGPNVMINADMKYNLGSYGGSIRGDVGRDLSMIPTTSGNNAGTIQTALGNIDINTGRDIILGNSTYSGAIRTTGEYTPGKTEIAPGLNDFLAMPEMASLLNPNYVPGNGQPKINPLYTNPLGLISGTLSAIADIIYANGGVTTGAANVASKVTSYWTYHNGGSIGLNVGRSLSSNLNAGSGWDGAYIDSTYVANAYVNGLTSWYLTAGFGGSKEKGQGSNIPVTTGIATMGGGDISIKTGGLLQAQIGAFGKGDVSVSTGGDLTGRFRATGTPDAPSSMTLTSAGNLGKNDAANITYRTTFELGNVNANTFAQGDVHIGTVQNPDNSRDRIFYGLFDQNFWNLNYTPETSFSAVSLKGDATLYGTNAFNAYSNSSTAYMNARKVLLPATFSLSASGDIKIGDEASTDGYNFIITPSEKGNLSLYSGGSIDGSVNSTAVNNAIGFIMQDNDISAIYGRQLDSGFAHYNILSGEVHNGINHLNDSVPITVSAAKNITNLRLNVNKQARISAGGDISNLFFIGQNNTSDSLTSIIAGGSIDQGIAADTIPLIKRPGIELGGPGTLLVQAGTQVKNTDGNLLQVVGNLNLGNSQGINSVGNKNNAAFFGDKQDTDSDVIVTVGANSIASMKKEDVAAFFNALQAASDEISSLRAQNKNDEADDLLKTTEDTVKKYFYQYKPYKDDKGNVIGPNLDDFGNINMVDSTISSRAGSIFAMAGSNINVGKTALSSSPNTSSGITTLFGGDLSIYAGNDINVNESRTMTFYGGDITMWSDQGDINAGRGSKTVVSAPVPQYNYDSTGVLKSITYTPPAAGSGIRALTFDVDGEDGPKQAPLAGDVHIYAKGTLDAGEAGIQGNNLSFAAGTVLNVQNISFGGTGTGVPSQNSNSINVGPMTGGNDALSDKKLIETVTGAGIDKDKNQMAENDDFLMKYLDVKVIDLSDGTL